MTTEMNTLTNGSTATSSVGGSSGIFTNSNTAQGMLGEIYFKFGGAVGSALSAGAAISGWFLVSPDGGTTFEATASGASQPRAPDFVIPLPATTISSGAYYKGGGPIMIPALEFKVFLQNNTGQSFPASGNILSVAPFAMQY